MDFKQEVQRRLKTLNDPAWRAGVAAELQRGTQTFADPKLRARLIADARMGWPIVGAAAVVLVGVGVLLGLGLGHSNTRVSGAPVAAATATTTAADAKPVPVVLSGPGLSKTAPFHLSGSYRVEYNVVNACSYFGSVKRVDGKAYLGGLNVVAAAQPAQGAKQLSNVPAADYYFDMIAGASTGCVWYVTFKPAA
jgi:hypothetical protein